MKRTFQNPVPYQAGKSHTNPDPYVLKFRGRYYCYSSDRDGVNVSESTNLVEWEHRGYAVSEEDRQEYWAPCVIYENGTFYMYCANTKRGVEDCHEEFLNLFTSKDPLGPFIYQKTFFQKFSIDAHVVRDKDGETYIFYSPNDYMGTDEDASGTVILVDRLINMTELVGEERAVVLPTIEEEIYEKNRFGDGRDWFTIEGACYFTHYKKAYVMYSANAFVRENYFMGYSSADSNLPIPDMKWKKYPDDNTFSPFICRNEVVEGTGHNSVIKAPNNVDDWIVYHGRNLADELIMGVEQRQMRIDPLYYDGDQLSSDAPSYEPIDAPRLAFYQDYFDILKDDWKIVDGNFFTKDFQLSLIDEKGIGIAVLDKHVENYKMEVDIKCELTHMGGKYGIMPFYKGEGDFCEVIFNSGRRTLSFIQSENNFTTTLADVKLPLNFDYQVYHNIIVVRCYDCIEVYLDGVKKIQVSISCEFGSVALVSRYTKTQFSGFSITKYSEMYGENMKYFSKLFRSDRRLKLTSDGIAHQGLEPVRIDSHLFHCNQVIQITFQVLGKKGSCHYNPVYIDENNQVKIYATAGEIVVQSVINGKETTEFRCEKDRNKFTIRTEIVEDKICLIVKGHKVVISGIKTKNYIQMIKLSSCMINDYASEIIHNN